MTLRLDRFAYEEAEKVLDDFAQAPGTSAQFVRSYRKFKFLLAAYAYADFGMKRPPNEQAFAYAWEEAQVAFVGHGEPILCGAVLQLWVHADQKSFKQIIKRAFDAAEAATHASVPRRYIREFRLKPPRTPQEGFNLPTILPAWGPTVEDWAKDNNEDLSELIAEFAWLEYADRSLREKEEAEKMAKQPKPTGKPRGRLRLVETES